jgi:hypothetical protein
MFMFLKRMRMMWVMLCAVSGEQQALMTRSDHLFAKNNTQKSAPQASKN